MPERHFNKGEALKPIEHDKWIPSRYNVRSQSDDGMTILYNSYSGSMGAIPPEQQPLLQDLLRHGASGELHELDGLARDLAEGGLLVKQGTDEFKRAAMLHNRLFRDDYMHLIMMPSEECNFRCVYCYESFPRGRMAPEVVEGIKNMLAERLPKIHKLSISWFGGEPLSEPDIVLDITDSFLPYVREHNIEYRAVVTTNGYFLTADLCKELTDRGIQTFNITLDGLQEDHDCTRILKGGGDTFEVITNNLKALKATDLPFKILIRNNFHPKTNIDAFIAYLAEEFGDDDRFTVYFRPVGKWGGDNDDDLTVCDKRDGTSTMFEANQKAIESGFTVPYIYDFLQPNGTMCYAAKPYSFVIGADGTLYKCTVALESDFNHVGKIHADGRMVIDYDKMAHWVLGGADDDDMCKRCFFRPSCQGAACPLVRIESGNRPCPKEKEKIKDTLRLMWDMHKRYPERAMERTVKLFNANSEPVLEGK